MTPSSASSWLRTPATRLGTVWKDWREIRSFASRRRRVSATTSFSAISGCSRISARMSVAGSASSSVSSSCLDAGGATLAVEHRQLAEDRAGPEGRQRDHAAVGVLAGDPAAAAAGRCSRRRRDRPRGRPGCRREAARDRDLRDPLELLRRELREQRHAAEELDDLLPCSCSPSRSRLSRVQPVWQPGHQ